MPPPQVFRTALLMSQLQKIRDVISSKEGIQPFRGVLGFRFRGGDSLDGFCNCL